MNYLDLFSGIGGFTLGLQQAGFQFDWLGHSETNKYANQIYENHYPQSEPLGDVKAIKPDRLPDLNLITFGFPCQDLSIAGKRGGLQAKRSGLFFEAMRIIRIARPCYFIFENVKGLFSSNKGQDWLIVLKEVADSGYDGQWQLLNTRWFLPQNRERIYFVGHIRGERRPEVFPIGENHTTGKPENKSRIVQTKNDISGCVQEGMGGRLGLDSSITLVQIGQVGKKDNMSQKVYSPNGIATTIKAEGGGQGAKTGLYQVGTKRGDDRSGQRIYSSDGLAPSLKGIGELDAIMVERLHGYNKGGIKKLPSLRGSSMEHNDFIANAVDCDGYLRKGERPRDKNGKPQLLPIGYRRIRRLTPIECERLQGFSDNWTEGISDTQRYKCLETPVLLL
jgi:DNA (cytosine-5)-methyltransferase 1